VAERARYLYAVTRPLTAGALEGQTGIDDRPLAVVVEAGLGAVVSDVDLDAFGEEGLRRNLESMEWLERVARKHDDVVNAVARTGPTAPMRLATICLDDDGVRARLIEWRDEMTAALDRVEGRSEWSVKVVLPPTTTGAAPHPTVATDRGAGAGAAYLLRKRQETELRARTEQDALDEAAMVYDRLAGLAVAGRRLTPQDPRLSGHPGTMTLNAAFLVEDDGGQAFEETAAELGRSLPVGTLLVAGPWPPYSFATLEPA
jgi:hypothetical protein